MRGFAFDGSGKRLRARQIPCSGWTWAIRQRSLRGADHIIHVARDGRVRIGKRRDVPQGRVTVPTGNLVVAVNRRRQLRLTKLDAF